MWATADQEFPQIGPAIIHVGLLVYGASNCYIAAPLVGDYAVVHYPRTMLSMSGSKKNSGA